MTPPDSIRVHLSFGRSSSCYYPYAVGLAEDLPGYEQSGEGRRLRHSVDVVLPLLESELWDRVLALYRIIIGWNSGEVRLENTPFDSLSDLGQSLANVRECYARREETGLGDAFCSGKIAPDADAEAFGCHHIGGVTRSLPNRGQAGYQVRRGEFSWWQFGTLAGDN
ncbi:MAG: hypothetical protein JXA57_08395, partial [Armatimonadetes bacterium]|nr:hypothetical protein [Armatimonadota bacterium]